MYHTRLKSRCLYINILSRVSVGESVSLSFPAFAGCLYSLLHCTILPSLIVAMTVFFILLFLWFPFLISTSTCKDPCDYNRPICINPGWFLYFKVTGLAALIPPTSLIPSFAVQPNIHKLLELGHRNLWGSYYSAYHIMIPCN